MKTQFNNINPPSKTLFSLLFNVRDYECDIQGVVNHANYLHYFEHTRHHYLLSLGKSFSDWHKEGFDLMVSNLSINYKQSLISGDTFNSHLYIHKKQRASILFYQELIRQKDQLCVCSATIRCACLKQGHIHPLPF